MLVTTIVDTAEKLPQPKYLNLEYFYTKLFDGIKSVWDWISGIDTSGANSVDFIPAANLLSVILAVGVILVLYKIHLLRREKITTYTNLVTEDIPPEKRRERWDEIKRHMESPNPIEWKMAIIEADSLMDEIIKGIGYKGQGLGERLKEIEPSDFDNLQNVWDAHKLRNRLAHDPGRVDLNKSVADSTIKKYEDALKELKYL